MLLDHSGKLKDGICEENQLYWKKLSDQLNVPLYASLLDGDRDALEAAIVIAIRSLAWSRFAAGS
jgi:hypothetical protein